jgi:ring-1,2-phenylacetyl-CoA epoxidase subunit PaaB
VKRDLNLGALSATVARDEHASNNIKLLCIIDSVISRGSPALWEVFVRGPRGLAHVHAGTIRGADASMALRYARDVYARRGEGASIWVVPASSIVGSSPAEEETLFEPRSIRPTDAESYEAPDGVSDL